MIAFLAAGVDLDGSIHSAIGELHELEVLDLSKSAVKLFFLFLYGSLEPIGDDGLTG